MRHKSLIINKIPNQPDAPGMRANPQNHWHTESYASHQNNTSGQNQEKLTGGAIFILDVITSCHPCHLLALLEQLQAQECLRLRTQL